MLPSLLQHSHMGTLEVLRPDGGKAKRSKVQFTNHPSSQKQWPLPSEHVPHGFVMPPLLITVAEAAHITNTGEMPLSTIAKIDCAYEALDGN